MVYSNYTNMYTKSDQSIKMAANNYNVTKQLDFKSKLSRKASIHERHTFKKLARVTEEYHTSMMVDLDCILLAVRQLAAPRIVFDVPCLAELLWC